LVMPMRLGVRELSRSELGRFSQGRRRKTVSGKQKAVGGKQ
jgi:hypothetical protein